MDSSHKRIGKRSARIQARSGNCNQRNPLMEDAILDKIFHLIFDPIGKEGLHNSSKASILADVKSFRLVCKVWRTRSTGIFRQLRRPFELNDNKRLDIQEFVSVMSKSEMIPLERYSLDETFLMKKNRELLQEFLEVCGPEVVELKLELLELQRYVKTEFPDAGLKLPKFRKLTVYINTFDWNGRGKNKDRVAADFVALLLSLGTNLEELVLDFDFECMRDMSGYHEMLQLIPGSLQKIKVKPRALSNTFLEVLAEKNGKLEEFEIIRPCEWINCTPDAVRKFFTSMSGTLQRLKWPASEMTLFSEEFPSLSKLTELMLTCNDVDECVPIDFPVMFPNLVEFSFERFWDSEETLNLLSNTNSAWSVEKIRFPEHGVTAELVKRAVWCFPNAKKLYIRLHPRREEILEELFTGFPGAEELTISFLGHYSVYTDGDAILSGVSSLECDKIRRDYDFKNVDLGKVQQRASILQLTKLRKLDLRFTFEVKFTDFSAQLIFLKMESLEEMWCCEKGFEEVSLDDQKLIGDKLKKFVVVKSLK